MDYIYIYDIFMIYRRNHKIVNIKRWITKMTPDFVKCIKK